MVPSQAPTGTPKNTKMMVIVEPPTKTIDKPFLAEFDQPEGTEVRIKMTLLEYIQYGKVSPLSKDGSEGVQRGHENPRSALYAQSILDSFTKGTPSRGLRHDPVINFTGVVTSGPALKFSPDTKVDINDGQHFFYALQRVYAEGMSTTDPTLKLRIRTFLEDTEILVRVTLDWSLEDQRRLFHDINGRAKVVSGSMNAYYETITRSAGPMQLAGDAVELLRTHEESPFRNRIGISGSTPKGGFAFQVLQKMLAQYFLLAKTPDEMASQFANYWTAVEGTFPEQKELTNTGYRHAFLELNRDLSKTGVLDQLAKAIEGQLSVLMPFGATGSKAIQTGVKKNILQALADQNNGYHGEDDSF